MNIDMQRVADIVSEVGVTEIMPRFRHLQADDIQTKSDSSVVTIADQMAEKALIARLQDYWPGSQVLGEELYESNPNSMKVFDSDDFVWVIDPIDGTSSFMRGEATFGTMVALMRHGEVLAAWIHDPHSRDTLMAEKGAGAFFDGQKLRMNTQASDSVGLLGSRMRKLVDNAGFIPPDGWPAFEYGACSAFDYPRLLTLPRPFAGRPARPAQFLGYYYTSPWDHLPGTFIVHETGGYAANWSGQPYDFRQFDAGLFICENPRAAAALKSTLDSIIRQVK